MSAVQAETNPSLAPELFVARQPIFLSDRKLDGYELLFRTGEANVFPVGTDPDKASKEIIGQTISVFGLDALVGSTRAYLNVTRRVLVDGIYTCLPPGRVVLELLETLQPDPELLAACRNARDAGYTLALDDYSGQEHLAPFVPYCNVIKVDFRSASDDASRQALAERKSGGPRLLAEKVENEAEFARGRELGFDYFQGYFFCKPEMMRRQDVPVSKVVYLQLLSALNRPVLDFNRLETVMKQDVALTLKFLRYLKAATFGFRTEITSIKQALAMLGERPFRRWVSVLVMAQLSADRPAELLCTCLTRARFCELLASELGFRGRELDLFAVGMFSLMDAIVARPLAELLSDVALPADLVAALIPNGKPNRAADVLSLAIAYERGDWDDVDMLCKRLELTNGLILPRFYQEALGWAASTAHASQ